MRRKGTYAHRRAVKGHENTERWLVSYADFITLLFGLFVVMFAVSLNDKNNARAVSESIKKALTSGGLTAATKTKPQLAPAYETLQQQLSGEIAGGSIRLSMDGRGLIVSLEAGSFFPSAAADINPDAYASVAKVADVIGKLPNSIRLEGHTDSQPIRNGRFQSNWELSASRSIAMLRLLSERFGVDTKRMSVAGFADTQSIESNATEIGRIHNRRVDIVILNAA